MSILGSISHAASSVARAGSNLVSTTTRAAQEVAGAAAPLAQQAIPIAAPIVGGVFGGPAGAALGKALTPYLQQVAGQAPNIVGGLTGVGTGPLGLLGAAKTPQGFMSAVQQLASAAKPGVATGGVTGVALPQTTIGQYGNAARAAINSGRVHVTIDVG